MKIIITESQFNSIVPPPLRRRLNNMVDIMNDVMLNYGMYLDTSIKQIFLKYGKRGMK